MDFVLAQTSLKLKIIVLTGLWTDFPSDTIALGYFDKAVGQFLFHVE